MSTTGDRWPGVGATVGAVVLTPGRRRLTGRTATLRRQTPNGTGTLHECAALDGGALGLDKWRGDAPGLDKESIAHGRRKSSTGDG